MLKKKYGAMLKKETHEALKIAKEKNGTHEGSKC
jgi:hypothetical protein